MSQLTILRGYRDPTKNDLLADYFRLPISSEPLSELAATFGVHGTGQVFSGNLYLFKSFLCFQSYDKRSCVTNIPLYSIRRVERLSTINQPGTLALSLILWHGLKLVVQLNTLKPTSDEFCNHLKHSLREQLSQMKHVKAFAKGCYSERLVGEEINDNDNDDLDHKDNDNDNDNDKTYHHGLGVQFKYPGDPKKLREKTKLRLWKEYFRLHGRNITLVRYPQFIRLVQVGLPSRLRGEMWEILSGSIYDRFANPGEYQHILELHDGQSSMATDEIEKDLNRSLPEYGAYQDPAGIAALRRVLTAYSWRNQELGYCQAMNILVAALLIYMSEEQAFWFLDKICTRILPGYYSASMYGTLLDQKVFEHLVQRTMPSLHEHFVESDIQLSVSSLPWFLSLYINSMPLVFAFRIIDCFVAFGPRVLFQVGLAALKVNYAKLIDATDDGMVLNIFRDYFASLEEPVQPNSTDPKVLNITNFSELLVVAFREFSVITDDTIIEERRRFRAGIVKSIELFSKRSAIRNLKDQARFGPDGVNKIFDHFFYALCKTPTPLAALPPSTPSKLRENEELSDRTETVIDLATFRVFLSDIATWARDEKIINNGFQERIVRSVPENEIYRKLFKSWDYTGRDALGLQDLVRGLDSVVFNGLLDNIEWFFNLHDSDNDGYLTKDELVQLSESLLFIFRAEPGDAYLGAVSKFMTNAFEYADSLIEQPQAVKETNKNDEPSQKDPLSATEVSDNCVPGSPQVSNHDPYINLATFRMVCLADELLEAFFDTDLRQSFKFEDVPQSAIDQPLIDLSTLDDIGIGSTGLVGNILGGIFSKDNKEILNGIADEIGKSIGKHQVIYRPSFGRVNSEVEIEEKRRPAPEEKDSSIVSGVANLLSSTPSWFSRSRSDIAQAEEQEMEEKTRKPEETSLLSQGDQNNGESHLASIKAAQEALANRQAFAIDQREDDDEDFDESLNDDEEAGGEFAIGSDEDDDMIDEVDAIELDDQHAIVAEEAEKILNAPVDKDQRI
ncbi:TBC-domain-containing protein [Wallemia mellicola]|uniref:TBC-domain-containing protein n=1 Tax=Wallemia mellicola TaxID=1708541 RepID=A0A4T0PPM5_9BASI|nr:TBC-domain-containing protein [Wallemia mellicola]TIC57993.1 TBC-domain-containing protein [Wallemia mellicola]TIC67258.1 TBC-domain-containing protein [Wallemia mellicola]